jgi:hypothetical protein
MLMTPVYFIVVLGDLKSLRRCGKKSRGDYVFEQRGYRLYDDYTDAWSLSA